MSDPKDTIESGDSKGFAVAPGGVIVYEAPRELNASVQIRTRDGTTVTATLAAGSTLQVQTHRESEPLPDSIVISILTASAGDDPATAH
jgi:hypothetical protein